MNKKEYLEFFIMCIIVMISAFISIIVITSFLVFILKIFGIWNLTKCI